MKFDELEFSKVELLVDGQSSRGIQVGKLSVGFFTGK